MERDDIMKAPCRLDEHALARFIERWWPYTDAEWRLRAQHKKDAARQLRLDELHTAVMTRAYCVENIPNERQSIWAWTVCAGPHKGSTALMVVAQDGTVRTVLPPDARRPAGRRPRRKR